jgi:predicted nucleotidyltransferase/uncharacterized protein (UPF0332 family)
MDFTVKKKGVTHKDNYQKKDIDIAYAFAKKILREFGTFLRTVVLFGSSTKRNSSRTRGDIDILIIVDDVTYELAPEVVETYRVVIEKTIAETSLKLHVTTLKFTTFWEYMRVGDPIGINMLRTGVALIDTGFFYPLQLLLYSGRIRPSNEAVEAYQGRAKTTLHNSQWHILQASLDLYWSVIDSAQAALMRVGVIPPPPEKVSELLKKHFVDKNLLHKKHLETMKKFYTLSRMILHREIRVVTGKSYDQYFSEAKDFVNTLKKIR